MNLKDAVQFILSIENLRSKADLEHWCGDMGKKKLYLYVERLTPDDWNRIRTPRESIRFYYQQMLTGYKISRHELLL